MTARLRDALLSTRDLLLTVGPFVALGLALLALAYWALDPTPPRRMVLATGPAQGAYAEFAPRYVQALRRHGIQVELRATEGSAENLRLLRAGEVDAAFVQAGNAPIDPPEEDEDDPMDGLASLGSLFLEPVWIFYREAAAQERLKRPAVATLAELSGWRVNVGTVGSGVPRLVGRLLDANGLPRDAFELSHSAPTPAVVGLLAGELDALVFAQAPESPLVQMLLRTPGVGLLDLAQAEAYARRVPSVSPVRLPRGVVDLAQDLPPADVHLVAPTAMLLVREDTHPALQQLLVQAARAVHGTPGWFQRKGEFPTAAGSDVTLSPEAERFYRSGPPLLQRHLPFWLANLIDRMWVVLVSLVAVLIPLSRVLPPLYVFRIRSRIFRWYAQLRRIEDAAADAQADRAALREELEAVDRKVQGLSVPLSHADELYSLRSHIAMVRRRLAD